MDMQLLVLLHAAFHTQHPIPYYMQVVCTCQVVARCLLGASPSGGPVLGHRGVLSVDHLRHRSPFRHAGAGRLQTPLTLNQVVTMIIDSDNTSLQ